MRDLPALNPERLDVARLAERGHTLRGELPLAGLERLMADAVTPPDDQPDDQPGHVRWEARGEQRPVQGGEPQVQLHLQAKATVWQRCQRCLQPVALPLEVERRFAFAPDEAQAEALDAQTDEVDVLALTRSLNLFELIEDELLLALPLVPRHEACPAALPVTETERVNPFAVLASLKRQD